MKLREFPLLTDENVDPEVVAGLRRLGFDVFDVVDVVEGGRAGASDVDLPRWATSQGRVARVSARSRAVIHAAGVSSSRLHRRTAAL